ncbi:hypothetical protein FRC08_008781 [Ceratobasidium sp. 394]|nr:hypothetical protein FRC08_008781 [Ceratobasidium sp. 394]
MTGAPPIEFIELSSTSDMCLDSGIHGGPIKHNARTGDSSSLSSQYCREWVSKLRHVPSTCGKNGSAGPSYASESQGGDDECNSEAEVESLIQVELNENRDIGPIHSPTPQRTGGDTPLSHPTSHVRTVSRCPTIHYIPHEFRTPEPDDRSGPKQGDIHYLLPPLHLTFLTGIGSKWTFSHTAPTSKCRNRIVGDIHFAPGEVRGFSYWVCCRMKETKFGRGWVLWERGDAHPLYPELILQHFNSIDSPSWALKLEE